MVQNYNIKFIAQNIFAKSATLIYINVLSLYIHLLLYINNPYVASSPFIYKQSLCSTVSLLYIKTAPATFLSVLVAGALYVCAVDFYFR